MSKGRGTGTEVRNISSILVALKSGKPVLLPQDLGLTPLGTSPFSGDLKKISGNSKLKGPMLNMNSALDMVPIYPLFLWLAGSPADWARNLRFISSALLSCASHAVSVSSAVSSSGRPQQSSTVSSFWTSHHIPSDCHRDHPGQAWCRLLHTSCKTRGPGFCHISYFFPWPYFKPRLKELDILCILARSRRASPAAKWRH